MTAPDSVHLLVDKFERDRRLFQQPDYNEAQLRQEFVNPFFAALGWDVGDRKQVLHEAGLRSGGSVKHPDYSFLAGSRRVFYVETKKPAINIGGSVEAAEQLRLLRLVGQYRRRHPDQFRRVRRLRLPRRTAAGRFPRRCPHPVSDAFAVP